MGQRVTRVLCVADPRGDGDALRRLHEQVGEDVHAIAVIGDLSADGDPAGYRSVFKALGKSGLPSYWVPGPGDAPVEHYLREAHNMEVVFPFLHGIHATVAFAGSHVLFAGVGGEISDDPEGPRDETGRLSYPRWEPEYRLRLLRELDEHQLAMAFWSPPEHKGQGLPGSEVVAELIATFRPRLVVCSGDPRSELIGRSVIVAPGRLADGCYAIAHLQSQEVELATMSVPAQPA
jgi:Icc-related predicted phosphoesterase